ncbi:MAG: adenine deaminase [Deltaproteobacteria bacterium]|jgi:adenine deaminase|nr:adenine deaminase [Deltaproteobacteria bacterium]
MASNEIDKGHALGSEGQDNSPLRFGEVLRRSQAERVALIETALGRRKAELVLKKAKVYNPYLRRFEEGDLAITGGRVAALGTFKGIVEYPASGGYLISGFIDSHVHLESSMLSPQEFAKTLAINGVTTAVCDPHEIANVAGLKGLKWFLEASKDLPIELFFMAPSCVPSSNLEKGGAELSAADVAWFQKNPRVLGLAEMMNYPGVLRSDPSVLAKLELSALIDGHAPALKGAELMAYYGSGISTDHECVTAQEALERLKAGVRVLIREGSAAKNLEALIEIIDEHNHRFFQLATDDRNPMDLLNQGSINYLVAKGLKLLNQYKPKGEAQNLFNLLNMATINGCEHYGLLDLGSLVPGRLADMALYANLTDFKPLCVWKRGRLVVKNGLSVWKPSFNADHSPVMNTVKINRLLLNDLKVKATGSKIRVIKIVPGQIITESLVLTPPQVDGYYEAIPEQDIAKIAVFDRYDNEKPPAVGFIEGLGLRRGAVATTVSHDSHNLVVAGTNDRDMFECAQKLEALGGGLALAAGERKLISIALPLGGLMSLANLKKTSQALENVTIKLRELGFNGSFDPLTTLSFMSLPVIPSLKLTVDGLVDVNKFDYTPVVFD